MSRGKHGSRGGQHRSRPLIYSSPTSFRDVRIPDDFDEEHYKNYEYLGAAIIGQAVEDYKGLKERNAIRNTNGGYSLAELSRFFKGEWFKMLSPLEMNGEQLMTLLDKQVLEEKKKKYNANKI